MENTEKFKKCLTFFVVKGKQIIVHKEMGISETFVWKVWVCYHVLATTAKRTSARLAHQQSGGQRKYVGVYRVNYYLVIKRKILSVSLSSVKLEDITFKEKLGRLWTIWL